MRARPVQAIACGAEGGGGRTGIVSSVVELRLPVLSSSGTDRAVEHRHHLEEGHFSSPTTWQRDSNGARSYQSLLSRLSHLASKGIEEGGAHVFAEGNVLEGGRLLAQSHGKSLAQSCGRVAL